MKSKSALGQEIRWVQKYNRAMRRVFRHWGEPMTGTISNIRAFKRHFHQARKNKRRHHIAIIDMVAISADDQIHVEPQYSNE